MSPEPDRRARGARRGRSPRVDRVRGGPVAPRPRTSKPSAAASSGQKCLTHLSGSRAARTVVVVTRRRQADGAGSRLRRHGRHRIGSAVATPRSSSEGAAGPSPRSISRGRRGRAVEFPRTDRERPSGTRDAHLPPAAAPRARVAPPPPSPPGVRRRGSPALASARRRFRGRDATGRHVPPTRRHEPRARRATRVARLVGPKPAKPSGLEREVVSRVASRLATRGVGQFDAFR